jgi:hypothetical protein
MVMMAVAVCAERHNASNLAESALNVKNYAVGVVRQFPSTL